MKRNSISLVSVLRHTFLFCTVVFSIVGTKAGRSVAEVPPEIQNIAEKTSIILEIRQDYSGVPYRASATLLQSPDNRVYLVANYHFIKRLQENSDISYIVEDKAIPLYLPSNDQLSIDANVSNKDEPRGESLDFVVYPFPASSIGNDSREKLSKEPFLLSSVVTDSASSEIFVAGYPSSSVEGTKKGELKITRPLFLISRSNEKIKQLIYEITTEPKSAISLELTGGMSGGPIISSDGKWQGIHAGWYCPFGYDTATDEKQAAEVCVNSDKSTLDKVEAARGTSALDIVQSVPLLRKLWAEAEIESTVLSENPILIDNITFSASTNIPDQELKFIPEKPQTW